MADQIQPIKPAAIQPLSPAPSAPTGQTESGKSFKEILSDYMDKYNEVQKEYQTSVADLVTGKTDNIAEVVSAAQKAEITSKLMIQLRNKIVDAYEEIMRMRV